MKTTTRFTKNYLNLIQEFCKKGCYEFNEELIKFIDDLMDEKKKKTVSYKETISQFLERIRTECPEAIMKTGMLDFKIIKNSKLFTSRERKKVSLLAEKKETMRQSILHEAGDDLSREGLTTAYERLKPLKKIREEAILKIIRILKKAYSSKEFIVDSENLHEIINPVSRKEIGRRFLELEKKTGVRIIYSYYPQKNLTLKIESDIIRSLNDLNKVYYDLFKKRFDIPKTKENRETVRFFPSKEPNLLEDNKILFAAISFIKEEGPLDVELLIKACREGYGLHVDRNSISSVIENSTLFSTNLDKGQMRICLGSDVESDEILRKLNPANIDWTIPALITSPKIIKEIMKYFPDSKINNNKICFIKADYGITSLKKLALIGSMFDEENFIIEEGNELTETLRLTFTSMKFKLLNIADRAMNLIAVKKDFQEILEICEFNNQ